MPSQPIASDWYPGPLLISAGEKDTTRSSKMSKRLSERYAAGGVTAEQLHFSGRKAHGVGQSHNASG